MIRFIFVLFLSGISFSLLAQAEEASERSTRFGLSVSHSTLGEDLDAVGSGQTAGLRFRLERGPVFSMTLELESSINYDYDVNLYAINFIPTWKMGSYLNFMLGGGMGYVESGDAEPGLTMLAGFSVPIGKHFELFARYDYLFVLESGGGQVSINNESFKVSAAKAGVAFYF